MRGISPLGVVAGTIVTLALDVVVGMALMAVLGAPHPSPTVTHEQYTEAVTAFVHSAPYLGWSLVLGTLTTVIGGYVSARVGKSAPYVNSALVGAVGIVMGFVTASGVPLWFNALAFAFAIPSGLLGGYMATRGRENA